MTPVVDAHGRRFGRADDTVILKPIYFTHRHFPQRMFVSFARNLPVSLTKRPGGEYQAPQLGTRIKYQLLASCADTAGRSVILACTQRVVSERLSNHNRQMRRSGTFGESLEPMNYFWGPRGNSTVRSRWASAQPCEAVHSHSCTESQWLELAGCSRK